MTRLLRFSIPALLLALAIATPRGSAQPPTTPPTSTTAGPTGPIVDITLDSMRGGQRSLSSERGHRGVVLFYEDRPHLEDNATIKTELSRFIVDNHLDERLVVIGVANLGDVGSVPQTLVRQMIQPLVDRWNVDILLDWQGQMRQAPFDFRTHAANTAVLDRDGRMIYAYTGTIEGEQRRLFYRAIRSVIAAP